MDEVIKLAIPLEFAQYSRTCGQVHRRSTAVAVLIDFYAGGVAESVAIGEITGIIRVRNAPVELLTTAALEWWLASERAGCQSEPRRSEASQPEGELLQCAAARDGLGQCLRQFIEFVVHNFPLLFVFSVASLSPFVCFSRLRATTDE
jgi:hypothetical protein